MQIKDKQHLEIILEQLLGEEDIHILTTIKNSNTLGPLYSVDVVEDELHLVGVSDQNKNPLLCSQLLFILNQYKTDTKLKLVTDELHEEVLNLNDSGLRCQNPFIILHGGRDKDQNMEDVTCEYSGLPSTLIYRLED